MRGRRVMFVPVLVAACAVALAQDGPAPPIKPGLWQVTMEREVDGKKMPDMTERLKSLPPEARKQMESMLKQRGMDPGGGMGARVCLDKSSLDRGQWQQEASRCKTEYLTRTSSLWTWHSSCTDPKTEIDGEARFSDAEHYRVKMQMRSTTAEGVRQSNQTISAQWQSADCGDVAPVRPPTRP